MSGSGSRLAATLSALVLVAFAGAALLGSNAAFADTAFTDDTGGVGITVTVSPAPTAPGAVGSPAVPGSASSGTGTGTVSNPSLPGVGVTGVTGNTVVTGGAKASAPVPAADEFDLGGIVFVSGVTSGYGWSINPLGGDSHAEFTVHNVSQFTFDGTAGFQLVGPFGNEIARVDGIRIDQLKPDESRVIEATLTGLGQWTFFTTHATFTPPENVGGTALSSITRDGFLFVLPWFLLVLLIVAAGAVRVVTIIRTPPAGAAAAAAAAPSAALATEGSGGVV
ncbi:hypothetical protein B7R54_14740 [Subtercola boreus]|uniref:Uncharacterized protein n=1 Tax=Subtercola boreus TaxID=120213 RepID=A0A3E0VKB2_9MICO|nr:hypothetical protein [Subtercola boreus]RFA10326.1 hypothetical protein B7R54_14740 [Subtercola boreus]TQL56167.1 hypothetical protein FB464_3754 [Subtercola boreus]